MSLDENKLDELAKLAFNAKYSIISRKNDLQHYQYFLDNANVEGTLLYNNNLLKIKTNDRIRNLTDLIQQSQNEYKELLNDIDDYLLENNISGDFKKPIGINGGFFTLEYKDRKSEITNIPPITNL